MNDQAINRRVRMINIAPWQVASLLVLVLGCSSNEPRGPLGDAEANDSPGPKVIGPQFWKYDLDEYDDTEQDVMYGLGGRWISNHLVRRKGAETTKDLIRERITTALVNDGWERISPRADRKYVLSKIWDTSSDDLCFRRQARDDEPKHWFFYHTIYVSDDASIICLYAEVGW